MFNVEYSKLPDRWSLKFSRRMLLNGDPGGLAFSYVACQKREPNFSWGGRGGVLLRNYGMVVILLSFLCDYENLTLKLRQKKMQLPWWRDGLSLAGSKLEVCQECVLLLYHLKSIKIHEYDGRPLIKSYNSY